MQRYFSIFFAKFVTQLVLVADGFVQWMNMFLELILGWYQRHWIIEIIPYLVAEETTSSIGKEYSGTIEVMVGTSIVNTPKQAGHDTTETPACGAFRERF